MLRIRVQLGYFRETEKKIGGCQSRGTVPLKPKTFVQCGCLQENGRVLSPWDLIQNILSSELKLEANCATDTSLYEFLRSKVIARGLSPVIIQGGAHQHSIIDWYVSVALVPHSQIWLDFLWLAAHR